MYARLATVPFFRITVHMSDPDGSAPRGTGKGGAKASVAAIMSSVMRDNMIDPSQIQTIPPEEIIRIVTDMQSCNKDDAGRARKYSRKYTAFMQQFPTLFQMACRPGMDMGLSLIHI